MTNMRYRRFGRTELSMPVLTCGGMRYQHSWKDVAAREVPRGSQANVEATVRRALELGITHLETARGYGSSELQLGAVLKSLPRERLIVQTKVCPSEKPRDFLKTFDRSLERLGLEYVDLLSLHGINSRRDLQWSLQRGGCLQAALALKAAGRARHIGFSTHATLEIILDAIESGDFEYVNLHYYFVNQPNLPAVNAAARRDMGVFIISPNDKGGKLYSPPPKLSRLCAPLTPMQFNDLFCLSHPQVHTLSIGAARPSDFDEHIAALAHYDALEETIAPIRARLEAEMVSVLGRDWCDHWLEGIGEHSALPGEVNVREILRLFTFAKSLDLVEWGKMRYNLLGRGDDWFPGKNAERLDEPALLRALAGSPFPARVLEALRAAHVLLAGEPQQRLSQR